MDLENKVEMPHQQQYVMKLLKRDRKGDVKQRRLKWIWNAPSSGDKHR